MPSLKQKTIEDLKKVISRDYKVELDDIKAQNLAAAILRLTKLAIILKTRLENNNNEHDQKTPS